MSQSAKLQMRQSLRQTQGLALTPQLMQSIKLLQMSAVELNNFVQSEIEKNPLLEFDTADEFPQERRGQATENTGEDNSADPRPLELDKNLSGLQNPAGTTDAAQSTLPRQSSARLEHGAGGTEYSGSVNDIEAYVASQQSLRDFLLQQAALTFRDDSRLKIAQDIIDLIDSDGYLRGDLQPLSTSHQVETGDIIDVLQQIQKFDPPGVGARNLAECMRLQLAEKNRLDPAMQIFTENLELLARRDYEKLASLCKVDRDDLLDMAHEIQELEPRPGEAFDPAPVQNIVPDIFVSAANDGSWQIELNTGTLPKVLINREYYAEIKSLGLGKTDKKFMVDNLQSANWLVASLDQRARTILKVATQIVQQQDMFFVKGTEFLKPLTLKNIAGKIDMHESTISRVTSNKYLACDRGIFELKYFFMSGIGGDEGSTGYGGRSIRLKIRNLIEAETASQVLSDERIASLLGEEGIDIARRTVTKYRESMGLLSSIQRRRELKALNGSRL